jgi:hypothetical protein
MYLAHRRAERAAENRPPSHHFLSTAGRERLSVGADVIPTRETAPDPF